MNNYVISIKNSTARRQHIQTIFTAQHIPFSFFDAYTQGERLDQAIQTLLPALQHTAFLSPAEKGCFISHLALWQQCIDSNLPYIGIFEDDVILGENADKFLAETGWLEDRFSSYKNWLIRLETYLLPTNYQNKSTIAPCQSRHFSRLIGTHYGTAGYIISQGAARKLLNAYRKRKPEHIFPIDHIFIEEETPCRLSIFQLVPALCVQEDRLNSKNAQLGSQIQQQRGEFMRTRPRRKKTA